MAPCGRFRGLRLQKFVLATCCASLVLVLILTRYGDFVGQFPRMAKLQNFLIRRSELQASNNEVAVILADALASDNVGHGLKAEAPASEQEAPAKQAEDPAVKEESPVTRPNVPSKLQEVPAAPQDFAVTTKANIAVPVPSQKPPAHTAMMTIIPPDLDPSYIGDVYSQVDNPFQTTGCPSSIRTKIKDTEFGRIFLEKVPILQWAPQAMPKEYARLRGYNPCYGWNLTSFDSIKETLDLLNTSANGYMFSDWNQKSSSHCIRCAVVGNGGILNGSKMGKEIDGHDYVFRVNGAILSGFEEDVGSRTSFYIFSSNTMMNSLYTYRSAGFRQTPQSKNISYVFIPDGDRDYYLVKAALRHRAVDQGTDKGKLPSDYFGQNYTREQFKIFHPDFMRYLRNRFLLSNNLRTNFKNLYRPSSGATMLLAAVHACDQVDAYGFLTPDFEKYSDHYFDKTKKKVMFYVNHDYNKEMRLWQSLHRLGIIKLYSRS